MPTVGPVLIATTNDDTLRYGGSPGTLSTSASYIASGDLSSTIVDANSSMRYVVAIPTGATITAATLEIYTFGSSGAIPTTTLKAELATAPTAPTSVADFDGRTLTTAAVSWTPASWPAATWNSVDVTALIAEVAALGAISAVQIFWLNATAAGWPGSASIIQGASYNTSTTLNSRITVVYTASGGGGQVKSVRMSGGMADMTGGIPG